MGYVFSTLAAAVVGYVVGWLNGYSAAKERDNL